MQLLIVACLFAGALASVTPEVGEPMVLSSKTTRQAGATSFCVAEHNRVRAQNRLSNFVADRRLEAAAARHNQVMVAQNCFSHQCPREPGLGERATQAGYIWSGLGENLANGHTSCQAAVNGWMNSPGHRANILSNHRHIGCHRNGRYYTCVFGNPR